DPVVADKAYFSIIAFNQEANVLLRLCDLSDVDSLPSLEANGLTSYGAAFRTLRETIAQDVDRLQEAGHKVYRPAAVFLRDARPPPRSAAGARRPAPVPPPPESSPAPPGARTPTSWRSGSARPTNRSSGRSPRCGRAWRTAHSTRPRRSRSSPSP